MDKDIKIITHQPTDMIYQPLSIVDESTIVYWGYKIHDESPANKIIEI
jgi:hypothetical protein